MDRRNILFFALVALIVIGVGIFQYTMPPQLKGSIIDPPKAMPNFTLSSVNGPVSLNAFHGKVVVLFFGFTHCRDICPATLAKLNEALTRLGDQAQKVQVVFVSVDYKRDTPETVGAFATKFSPDFIGLTGSQPEIDTVTKDYGIYYQLGQADANGDYEVEHTSLIMALDQGGQLVMTWSADQQPDEIASDLSVLVKK